MTDYSGLLTASVSEIVKRDFLGGTVVISIVGPSLGRKGLEKKLLPVSLAGLPGWERAHSQGNITGHESAFGIVYAPRYVNQTLQKLGVEDYIRQWLEVKPTSTQLVLTTVTYAHDEVRNGCRIKGDRLKQIVYKVEAVQSSYKRTLLFEGWIDVDDNTKQPRTTCGVSYHLHYGAFF